MKKWGILLLVVTLLVPGLAIQAQDAPDDLDPWPDRADASQACGALPDLCEGRPSPQGLHRGTIRDFQQTAFTKKELVVVKH